MIDWSALGTNIGSAVLGALGVLGAMRGLKREASADAVDERSNAAKLGMMSRFERLLHDADERANQADERADAAEGRRDDLLAENAKLVLANGLLLRDLDRAESKYHHACRVGKITPEELELIESGVMPLGEH
jgi:hypothetical protein